MSSVAWDSYVDAFHRQRPGITEEVLGHAMFGAQSPYAWLADALGDDRVVLDIACGSGPLAAELRNVGWVGIDVSVAELERAASRGARPLVRARADATPIASRSAGAVALMILQPIDGVLAEVARLLRPGGTFAVLVPTTAPLTLRDRTRYARLLVALRRRRLTYPNDGPLGAVGDVLARHGLQLVSDERRRFSCPISVPSVAVACVRSLYLPGAEPERVTAAEAVAGRWVGSEIGLPLRRIVAKAPA